MNRSVWLLIIALAACSGATPPEGYVESCYGGDFTTKLSGAKPIYSATLDIAETQWPELTRLLASLAEKHGVRLFNDTRHTEDLRMISISLCSEDGLFMNADRRIWSFEGEQPPALPLMVNVFAYNNQERWHGFAKDLDTALSEQWPRELNNKPNISTQLMTSPL